MTNTSRETVLVTGASGFIAMHCILKLLEAGYDVVGTLRKLERAPHVLDVLARAAGPNAGVSRRVTFCAANLESDAGWSEAVQGCTYVLHVASPVPMEIPKHPDELIIPARDGTLRVLRAATARGVRRVVMTSSIAAIVYGHDRDGSRTYDESDWANLIDEVGPYERSKTISERAAWAFIDALPREARPELVVINPGVVLGPILDDDFSPSDLLVKALLTRELPGCPDFGWALVDVRDVADAHVAALTAPEASGQRIIVALPHVPMLELATLLARLFGPLGFKVPARRIPDWVVKLLAVVSKPVSLAVRELGKRQDVSSERARALLQWTPRTLEQTLSDTGHSMIQHGVIAPGRRGMRFIELLRA